MKKMLRLFVVLSLLVNHAGCATVASGRTQDVLIRSNPSGADVLIDGMVSGTTPMLANLVRKKRHVIRISKPGYGTVTRATTRGFNWWYLGNIILGGIIGLVADPITGAIYEINPDVVYVDFEDPTTEVETEDTVKEQGEKVKSK